MQDLNGEKTAFPVASLCTEFVVVVLLEFGTMSWIFLTSVTLSVFSLMTGIDFWES
jgi:hypothetical protein